MVMFPILREVWGVRYIWIDGRTLESMVNDINTDSSPLGLETAVHEPLSAA
jgi:hypothetical protein